MNTAAKSLLANNVRALTDVALQAMAAGRDWASQVARDELARRQSSRSRGMTGSLDPDPTVHGHPFGADACTLCHP